MAAIFKIPFLVKRLFSTLSSTRNAIEHLNNRALVEIKGPDASNFLQGLITNDINHLNNDHEPGSMYTMFLNSKGRILYDSIIYKTEEPDVFWIECDSSASSSLQKYLKIYKLRRKVDILCLKDRQIYVAFNNEQIGQPNGNTFSGNLEESIYMPENTQYNISSNLLIFKDPRVAQLGFRIIAIDNEDVSAKNSIQALFNGNSIIRNKNEYKKLRYTLGIGEGIEDLPVENSFPLECNCDYLHGVSFHKGCYIGQELTARTHHTGVIRKRLMPLFFSKSPTLLPEKNSIIHNNVNLGKLRGVEGNLGLALLRFDQALNFETITVGNGLAHIVKPHWWPVELTKGKLNVNVK